MNGDITSYTDGMDDDAFDEDGDPNFNNVTWASWKMMARMKRDVA